MSLSFLAARFVTVARLSIARERARGERRRTVIFRERPALPVRLEVLGNMTSLLILDLSLLSLLLLDANLRLLRFDDVAEFESDLIRSEARIGRRKPISFELCNLVELDGELREAVVLFRI